MSLTTPPSARAVSRGASGESAIAIHRAAATVPREPLRPDVLWERDDRGAVTGYRVALAPCDAVSESPTCAEQ